MKLMNENNSANLTGVASGIVLPETNIGSSSGNSFSVLLPFLVAFSSTLYVTITQLYRDSDPFWAIAIGRWIAQNGYVPGVDVFSWTVRGETWFAHDWLYCLLIYWIDQIFGYPGIPVIVFLVYLSTAYVLFAVCRRLNGSNISLWIFAAGMWFMVFFTATPRAYIFTFLFIAVMIYLLHFYRHTWYILIVPVIMVLWINIQSSAVLGVGLLFFYTFAGLVFFREKRLIPIALISALATLINPYGYRIWVFVFNSFFSDMHKYINEFLAPDFNNRFMLAMYLVIAVTGVVASYSRKFRPLQFDRFMFFCLFWIAFIYSLTTVRVSSYAILFWIPFMAAHTPDWAQKKLGFKPVFAVIILLLHTAYLFYLLPERSFLTIRGITAPVNAVKYLELRPELQDRLYNSYIMGAYLMLKGIEVFIDARANVFADHGVLQDQINMERMAVKPDLILDKYDIRTVLICNGSPLNHYLMQHKNWKRQYQDEIAAIYVRVDP